MRILFANIMVALLVHGRLSAQPESFAPPGRLIDNGGYKMHLLVEKENNDGPTIIFFHGAGDIALNWNLILPQVGTFATAIAIDQNGEGWSEHGHGMSLIQQVYDSRKVLDKAGFKPPYIVVGHSLGGIIAHLFATTYKNEVDGVVMVDATHPDVVLKIYNKETEKMEWKKMRLTANESIPPIKVEPLDSPKVISSFQLKKDFGDMLNKFSEIDQKRFQWIYNERPWTYVKGQSDTYEAEVFQEMYENYDDYTLGNKPLIVITGGNKKVPKGDDNWSSEELTIHKEKLQKDLLSLSTNSKQIIAKNSGHHIHIDEPEIILSAIRQMIIDIESRK